MVFPHSIPDYTGEGYSAGERHYVLHAVKIIFPYQNLKAGREYSIAFRFWRSSSTRGYARGAARLGRLGNKAHISLDFVFSRSVSRPISETAPVFRDGFICPPEHELRSTTSEYTT